jgi:hypothetical protein
MCSLELDSSNVKRRLARWGYKADGWRLAADDWGGGFRPNTMHAIKRESYLKQKLFLEL